jgi:hypothetical protein
MPELLPPLPAFAAGLLSRALAFDGAQGLYRELQASPGPSLCGELLRRLEIKCRVAERDLKQIPSKGPVLVTANHPHGLLDGAALAAVLRPVRPDVRFLANGLLASVPELRELIIPVHVDGRRAATNHAGMRAALEHLQSGGLLVVFPAGEVASFRWSQWLWWTRSGTRLWQGCGRSRPGAGRRRRRRPCSWTAGTAPAFRLRACFMRRRGRLCWCASC